VQFDLAESTVGKKSSPTSHTSPASDEKAMKLSAPRLDGRATNRADRDSDAQTFKAAVEQVVMRQKLPLPSTEASSCLYISSSC